MRLNHTTKIQEKDYIFEKYMCPFCITSMNTPGELTIAIEKSTHKVAWTECTKGYANCCSIAELHAKFTVIQSH